MIPDSRFEQYWNDPSDKKVDNLFSQSNWRWLLKANSSQPTISCDRHDTRPEFSGLDMDKYLGSIRRRIDDDGYYSSANIDVYPPNKGGLTEVQIGKLQVAVKLLVDHGYPASFVLLLDECWDAVDSMRELMLAGTGNSVCNMDILAWLVDPHEGSGFSPHRDRQPENVASSFRSDGTPKYATCWLALSAAHCDNSCLYVIPKYLDPAYYKDDFTATDITSSSSSSSSSSIIKVRCGGNTETNLREAKPRRKKTEELQQLSVDQFTQYDPLAAALTSKESYQHIRALPLSPGEFVIFTHRIMHWGSKGRKTYTGCPRISLSVAFSDPTFEAPYFTADGGQHLRRPSFSMRLALACAQMIVYYQRYTFCEGELLLFKKCFDRYADAFDKDYRMKVFFEYSSAVIEIENAKSSRSVQKLEVTMNDLQSSAESKCKYHKKEENKENKENETEVEHEDAENNLCGTDEDFENESGDDENDDDDDEDDDDEDDDDDNDGGFFFSNEDEKDDPMEHALQALLDIDAETLRGASKRKSNSAAGERSTKMAKTVL